MNIRILTQHFYPDSATVSTLMTQLAIGLASGGHEVEVYTSQPRDDNAKNLPKYEVFETVKIFRLSSFIFNKYNKFGATLNYLYYFFRTLARVTLKSASRDMIYLIVTNPPFLPVAGVILSYLRKTKFISLMYDVLPEPYINIKYISSDSIYVKIWQIMNSLIYKKSTKIVVNTQKIKDTLEKRHKNKNNTGRRSSKINVISNWADGEYFKPIKAEDNLFIKQNNLQDNFLINYAGTIGLLQKFESLIEIAKKLKDEDIAFLLIGDGVKKHKLVKEKEKFDLRNIHFFPYQDSEMLPFAQAASNLSIVHLEREVEGYCMPSKLCSILATGTPVLALCDPNSELAKIVDKYKIGFRAYHDNTGEIIDFILKLKNNTAMEEEMRFNARVLFEKSFTKSIAINKYLDLTNSMKE